MEVDGAAQYEREIRSLQEKVEWQYKALEERDGVSIPQLEQKNGVLESTVATLRNENASLRHESSRFETTLATEKERFEAEKDEREQAEQSLRVWQLRCKTTEDRLGRLESQNHGLEERYIAAGVENRNLQAMNLTLHEEMDKIEAARDEALRKAEQNHTAAQRLQEIEDTLEPIFRDLGFQLTPQNLIERFTAMHDMSPPRPGDSEQSAEAQTGQRPSLTGRKPSIGDELSRVESDGNSEDNSPMALSHSPVSLEIRKTRRDGAASTEKDSPHDPEHILNEYEGGLGLETELGDSWSAIDNDPARDSLDGHEHAPPGTIPPDEPIRDLSDEQDGVAAGTILPDEPQDFGGASAEAGPSKELAKPEDKGSDVDDRSNRPLEPTSVAQTDPEPVLQPAPQPGSRPLPEPDREFALQNELASARQQIRDLLHKLARRPKGPTGGNTVTKYVSVVREATIAELLERAPWWVKLILMTMLILWAALTVSAWRERNLWLASNDTTFLYGRHLQSTSNQCHWAVVEWFENYIGLDKRLLG